MRYLYLLVLLLCISHRALSQSNGDFRSRQSGNWNASSTWQEFTAGSWQNTGNTPSSVNGVITVRSSHVVTVTQSVEADQVVVQSGATLSVSGGAVLTIANGAGNDLVNTGTVSIPSVDELIFSSGASYDHARNGGTIPQATWTENSECRVTGTLNNVPGGLNPSGGFYHFTWQAGDQASTINFDGQLTTVLGNLTFQGTNNKIVQLATNSAPNPLEIGGDFNIFGSSEITAATTTSLTINVGGNFNLNAPNGGGGNLILSAGSGSSTLNLSGDFNIVVGTLTETSNGTGTINFIGDTQQFISSGTIENNLTFVVGAGSSLNIAAESAILGNTFQLDGEVRLGSLNSAGALVTGNNGNIRTTNKIFNPGSRVVYAGMGPQFIGNAHPTAAGVTTEIDNPNGVTFNTTTPGNLSNFDLVIPGDLILTSGNFNVVSTETTGRILSLNGLVSANGNAIDASGPRTDIVINGSGAFGNFPFQGAETIRNFTFNRSGGSVSFDDLVTMTGSVAINSGTLDFNNTAILGSVILASGTTLFFEGQELTLTDNFTSSGGQLSADSQSTLVLTGSISHSSALTFSLSGNTVGNLILNQTNIGTSATINTPLTVTSTLVLSDGQLSIVANSLILTSGATISRSSHGSIITSAPSGGPWNVVYTGGSLTTALEIPGSGNLNSLTVDSNNSAVVTLSQSITVSNSIIIAQAGRTLSVGNRSITAGGIVNAGTINAPSAGAVQGLVLTGNFVNNGTFLHNDGTVTIAGAVTLMGSTIEETNFNNILISGPGILNPPATLRIYGNFVNDGSFVAGTGTVLFLGTSGSKIVGGSSDSNFFNLWVNKTNSGTSITINTPQTVFNSLALADGQVDFSVDDFTLATGATIIMNSDASILETPSGGPWHLEYRNRSKTTGLEVPASGQLLSLTINLNSGAVTLDQDIQISGALDIVNSSSTFTSGANNISAASFSNSGIFNAPNAGATTGFSLTGAFVNDATFNHSNGTFLIAGAVPLGGINIGSTNFYNLTILGTGSLVAPPGDLRIEGSFTNNGTFVAGTGTVFFRGSIGGQTIGGSSDAQFYDVNISKTNAGISLSVVTPQTITNSVTLTDGELDIQDGQLFINSNATVTRNHEGSITGTSPAGGPWNVVYVGNSMATSLELPSGGSLTNVTISMNSASVLTLSMSVDVEGSIWINPQALGPTFVAGANSISTGTLMNGGVFNAPSTTLTLAGNLTNNGTFNANEGTVVFDGNSILDGTETVTFHHLSITPTGVLTGDPQTDITGDFTNNGNFIANAGVVRFIGSAALQSIGGISVTDFENITINKTGGSVTLTSTQNLNGTLLFESPTTLASNGNLVVTSNSENVEDDGKIGPLPGGANVSGNVTVQRFMAAADSVERYISAPVSNFTVSQLQEAFPVTGSFSGTSFPCAGCKNNGTSMWFYREHVTGPQNQGFRPFPSNSNAETMLPGRGYLSFMWNGVTPSTINYTGPINSGQVDFIISHTFSTPPNPDNDGWNLVGNPYPSPIVWDNGPGWIKNQIYSVVYVWDADAYVFRTYDADTGLGDLPNGVIGTGQAFYAYALQPGASLSITEDAKTTLSGSFLRKKSSPPPSLTVSLGHGKSIDNSFIVQMKDTAFEPAPKFSYHEKVSVALGGTDGRKLVYYPLETIDENVLIPLHLIARDPGEYHLSFSASADFDMHSPLYLEDAFLGTKTNISETYFFTVSDDVHSWQDRFFITANPDTNAERRLSVQVFPNPLNDVLQIEVNSTAPASVLLKDAMGNPLQEIKMENFAGISKGRSDMRSLPSGLYIIQLNIEGEVLMKKVIKK